MKSRILTVAVAAASIAAATAAPLADAQQMRAVSAVEALPTPQRATQPVPSPTPKATPEPRPQATAKPAPKATQKPAEPKAPAPERKAALKPRPTSTMISGYRVCNHAPQPCIDAGSLTLYGQPYGVNILAGHNYQGYQWLSRLPVGRRVVVSSGPVAGTYRVTGHMRLNRQAGAIPSFGGAALVLQSCEGSGTGFSLLKRIS